MSGSVLQSMFDQKKRRVVGEIIHPNEVRNTNAWLSIHGSSKDQLLTYESRGVVASIVGSGSMDAEHPQSVEAAATSQYIMSLGGVVMTGGRGAGIMASAAQQADKFHAGVIFPELEKESSSEGVRIVVNSPAPRTELLATCAPLIIIFRGGLGTLMVLMRAIVHLRNRRYHPEQLPQVVFVNNYWIGLLTTMMNMGCLPREFLAELKYFDRADQIKKQMTSIKRLINQ